MRIPGTSLLVHLSASTATAALWRGGRCRSLQAFANDAPGRAAFGAFAARHARLPLRVVVESFEEDYALQELPWSSRRDGAQLLARRAAQQYRDCTFRGAAALPASRARSRRRTCLFAALTGETAVGPWIAALEAADCALAGIHPFSLVLAGLDGVLARSATGRLIVVRHADAFRFVFVRQGGMRLHRLTPVRGAAAAPDTLEAEIGRTRAYLEGAGLLDPSARLTCTLLGPASDRLPALDEARWSIEAIALPRLARTLRCPHADLTAIVLALRARSRPALDLAPASATERFRTGRRCLQLRLGAAATAVAGIAAVLLGLRMAHALEVQRHALAERLASRQAQLVRDIPDHAQLPAVLARAEATVHGAQRLQQQARFPHAAYRSAARILDRHPALVLSRLEWRTDTADALPAGATARQILLLHLALAQAADPTGHADAMQAFLRDLQRERGVSRVLTRRAPEPHASGFDAHPAPLEIQVELEDRA